MAGYCDTRELGIVESDETFFLESFKGLREMPRPPRKRGGVGKARVTGPDQIPVMVIRDSEGHTADFQLAKLNARHVREALTPLIHRESVLCTDGAAVYAAFARTRHYAPGGAGQDSVPCSSERFPHPER